MEVARRRRVAVFTGIADVDANDDLLSRLEVEDIDDNLQYLGVGLAKVVRDPKEVLENKLRLVKVLLADQGDRGVAAVSALGRGRLASGEVPGAADAEGHELAVANAELAIVFGVEVVGEADSLRAFRGLRVHSDPGEEDDTVTVAKIGVAAGEVLSLQLLSGKHAHIPVVVLERAGAVLYSSLMVVAVFVGGDEVEAKVAALRVARSGDVNDGCDK
ncbi:MAG: hypothetical protein IH864_04950 [Chloroflexi bacterium]|nr:hypothetical protein [Chloroflexota bacterium]